MHCVAFLFINNYLASLFSLSSCLPLNNLSFSFIFCKAWTIGDLSLNWKPKSIQNFLRKLVVLWCSLLLFFIPDHWSIIFLPLSKTEDLTICCKFISHSIVTNENSNSSFCLMNKWIVSSSIIDLFQRIQPDSTLITIQQIAQITIDWFFFVAKILLKLIASNLLNFFHLVWCWKMLCPWFCFLSHETTIFMSDIKYSFAK